jgi:two-component system CheB/CheR fusion protein
VAQSAAEAKLASAQAQVVATSPVDEIFAQLMAGYGIDFTHYKPTTVTRRIERRLMLRQITSIEEYVEELRQDPLELDALYKDLLIGVTRFFRDLEAFEALEQRHLPRILSRQALDEGLRIWVAGCATGEEAYSIAILMHEAVSAMRAPMNFKIFATDAHRDSLEFASAGVYTESAVADVSTERLERYFTRHDGQYKISPEIRRQVVFAPHNLIKDPPFTKIDLLTCRNLLIYFKPLAQRKVLNLFHFALNTGGVLFLGPSESVGELYDEFDPLDQHWKIMQKRRDVRQPGSVGFSLPSLPASRYLAAPATPRVPPPSSDLRLLRAYDDLLDRYVPASLLLNERGEVVHSFGSASKYLRAPEGRASLDVLQLVHEDLRIPISAALQKVQRERIAVSYSGVKFRSGDQEESLKLGIEPVADRGNENFYCFVTLEAVQKPVAVAPVPEEYEPEEQVRARIRDLEQELQYTREHLSATIEELETSNEELQATNEELVASNEELQSTNEELHSVNEELYTVNAEYQNKIDELTQLTNDMDNLLRSTDIGTVFLDTQLRIRKLTPAIGRSFHLLPQDVGRPIEHIASNLEYGAMIEDLREVLEKGQMIEREVKNRQGSWLLMRVLPYRVESGAVEGVVLTFTDVTAIRRAQQDLRQSEANFRQLADFVNAIFWLTSPDGSLIVYVSPAYEKIWKRPLESLCKNPQSWLEAVHPEDRERLRQSFAARNMSEEWEEQYRIQQPDGNIRWIRDRRYPVRDAKGQVIRLAGISLDITETVTSQNKLELTQFAVDNAGDLVFWLQPDGRIFYANESACRSLGYRSEELEKKSIVEIDVNRPGKVWDSFVGRLQSEGVITFESAFRRRDGGEIPVEVSSTCLRFGSDVYCCSIARDISARRMAERELSRYAAELERANDTLRSHNRELDEFAHLASHDLKEPLRAIVTFSQLLEQDLGGQLPSDAKRDLDFITNAATRMHRLINDLLSLSRAGRAEMKSHKVNLQDCVSSALEALSVRVTETGAHITIDALPSVIGDPTMLTQLYQNLIGNALKFSNKDRPAIHIMAVNDNGAWVFGVRDNGLGVKPEYSEKIFQPFRRMHVKSAEEGTGIGLAICRKVVERHGGRIWVESAPGQGSSFLFTIGTEVEEEHA